MTATAHLRGHPIEWDGPRQHWVYCDNLAPVMEAGKEHGPAHTPETAGSGQIRTCIHCGKGPTTEGHDGCLGTLPENIVMNACCGHGNDAQAYIQYWGGECIRGHQALAEIKRLKAAKQGAEIMKERPILFNADMVRAILGGRKTQTRRVANAAQKFGLSHPVEIKPGVFGDEEGELQMRCPYGQPGERSYVKETYWAWGRWETRFDAKKGRDAWHFVDMTHECGKDYQFEQPAPVGTRRDITAAWHKRPSIFMPRHASRITLEITAVRVERLQDIRDADAEAEGAFFTDYGRRCHHYGPPRDASGCPEPDKHHPQRFGWSMVPTESHEQCLLSARMAFANLWVSINATGSWEANPWVWVVEFKRVEQESQAA